MIDADAFRFAAACALALAGIVGAAVRMPPALGISAICGGIAIATLIGV
jgi:hypothetical protein